MEKIIVTVFFALIAAIVIGITVGFSSGIIAGIITWVIPFVLEGISFAGYSSGGGGFNSTVADSGHRGSASFQTNYEEEDEADRMARFFQLFDAYCAVDMSHNSIEYQRITGYVEDHFTAGSWNKMSKIFEGSFVTESKLAELLAFVIANIR